MIPATRQELAAALTEASAERRTLEVVGGGTHGRRGRPAHAHATLSTAGLGRMVAYEPADMTATVEAGMPVQELAALLGERGQCWPQAELRQGSTVGGAIASAASGRARLRFGPVRDSLLEIVVVTGDGRLVTGGGRTVKGVAGYDLPRLMAGALGTLGVIAEVTLKLWPLPAARRWFAREGPLEELIADGERLRRLPVPPAAVLLGEGSLHVELLGAPADVVAPPGMGPAQEPPQPSWRGTVEAGVSPPRLPTLAQALRDLERPFEAWLGTGICRVGVETAEEVDAVRSAARAEAGHAQVIDGPDDLRVDPWGAPPPGLALMRRLRAAFDPAAILNPGRFVGDAA